MRTTLLLCLTIILVAEPALARSDVRDFSVESATQTRTLSQKLLNVPFYMAGQSHPSIAHDLGVFKSNRRTNAFNKPDAQACRIAFVSAIIALQNRAKDLGGDAVVDIRSVTKHDDLDSPTDFRWAAGNVIANVALTGRVVTFR